MGDLDGRQIGVSYLCTKTSYEWRYWPTMIAMILGNNAALFGAAFAVMIAVARWYDMKHSNGLLLSIPIDQKYSVLSQFLQIQLMGSTVYVNPRARTPIPHSSTVPITRQKLQLTVLDIHRLTHKLMFLLVRTYIRHLASAV